MKSVLVMQGPNMNRLGASRPTKYYGTRTLNEIHHHFEIYAKELGITCETYQSNHEGALIDFLQERQDSVDALIVNPAGLTFYGDSFRQALVETALPLGIVHMSQVWARHDVPSAFRSDDLFADIASVYTAGLGWRGYTVALQALVDAESDANQSDT
jgi:3-dehydroquinate dehydratase II